MDPIVTTAEEIIAEVERMFAAEESLRKAPNGIEWGTPGARQRLWWEDPREGENGAPDLVRVRILTELGEVDPDVEEWPDGLWAEFLAVAEDNIWGGPLLAEEMEGRLCLAAAVSAHEGNAGYLPRVLFRAMAAHAAVREDLFDPEVVSNRGSFPRSAPAGAMGELADSFRLLVEAGDGEVPDGVERDMMFLVQQFQDFPCLMCNGDEGGLSAEFPFGEESSLLRIGATGHNACYGNAINLSLILPLDGEASGTMMKTVLELNRRDQAIHEIPWSLGSWYLDEQMSPRIGYRLWLPYALFQPNLLVNLGIGMAARARRCCETIAGMSLEEAFPIAQEAMMRRMEQLMDLMGGPDDED